MDIRFLFRDRVLSPQIREVAAEEYTTVNRTGECIPSEINLTAPNDSFTLKPPGSE